MSSGWELCQRRQPGCMCAPQTAGQPVLCCLPGACQLLFRGLAASRECVEVPHKVCQVCRCCYCCMCSEGVAARFATVPDGRGSGHLGLQDCSVLAALVGMTPTHVVMGVQVVVVVGAGATLVGACKPASGGRTRRSGALAVACCAPSFACMHASHAPS